jgi:SAM-dependent methyltransferase
MTVARSPGILARMDAILSRIVGLVPRGVKDALPVRVKDGLFDMLVRAMVLGRLLMRRRSKFVSGYLGSLQGIEIGASSHNRFYLDAVNVDRYGDYDTRHKLLERRLAGHVAKVDVVAPGDDLPFADDSYDFVFSSHVIEHFPDPIKALREWVRVASRYVVVIVPHRDRTFDADRPLTSVEELMERHRSGFSSEEDRHWSVWTCESFLDMCKVADLRAIDHQDPDDKVGNGFAVVIDARSLAGRSA